MLVPFKRLPLHSRVGGTRGGAVMSAGLNNRPAISKHMWSERSQSHQHLSSQNLRLYFDIFMDPKKKSTGKKKGQFNGASLRLTYAYFHSHFGQSITGKSRRSVSFWGGERKLF